MKFLDKKLIGFIVSIVFIALIFKNVDIKETLNAFNGINPEYLLYAVPVYYSSFIFRILRWRMILSNDKSISIKSLLSAMFTGYTANCFLPARVGDIYRAYILGKKQNMSKTTVLASIILERIFDGMVLFFILLVSVTFFFSKPWLYKLAAAAGIVFIGGFTFLMFLAKHSDKFEKLTLGLAGQFSGLSDRFKTSVHKLNYLIKSFTSGLDVFNSFSLTVKSLLFSLAVWLCEGITMMFVIKSFGIHITPLTAFFVLGVTTLSTMIPSGPASLGPYQFGYMLALGLLGVGQETALAISFVNQSLVILMVSAVGVLCILKDHINLKEIESAEKIPIAKA